MIFDWQVVYYGTRWLSWWWMNKDRPKYTIFNLIPYPFRLSCCHYEVFAHYVIPETSKIDICMFTSEGNYPVVDGPIPGSCIWAGYSWILSESQSSIPTSKLVNDVNAFVFPSFCRFQPPDFNKNHTPRTERKPQVPAQPTSKGLMVDASDASTATVVGQGLSRELQGFLELRDLEFSRLISIFDLLVDVYVDVFQSCWMNTVLWFKGGCWWIETVLCGYIYTCRLLRITDSYVWVDKFPGEWESSWGSMFFFFSDLTVSYIDWLDGPYRK